MPDEPKPRRRSRVPTGRLERIARIGWMAGEMALGGAAESVRRLAGAVDSDANPFLSAANAQRLARRLSTLRGAAMKLGQLLSLEGDDLLPPEFSEALAVLRADADAMPERQLRAILAETYGADWERRFREFDFEPVAAASIGQVHAATAADGRELALKVQYPGVSLSIDSDVDNLATALQLARILPGDVDFSEIVAEAKQLLHDESNYQLEADHLRRYGELLADEHQVRVPGVHADLTTRNILAMDYLPGLPLEDLCGPEHGQEDRDRMGRLLLEFLLREIFEFRFIQSDPNFANFLLLPDGRLGLLDLGAAREVPVAIARGYARLCRAALADDRSAMEHAAREMGFLSGEEGAARTDAFVALLSLTSEPLREEGVYDFGNTDLPTRAREAGMGLVFDHGFLRPPPAETLFVQRKLGGTFLLCARLRARVDVRTLIQEALSRAPK